MKSFNVTLSALFTALICVTAQISFITPSVPLTLQIFGIALCGYTLPLKWALASVITYLSVGAMGLPVFSGFRGGIQMLLGPTGGFLFGFILLVIFCAFSKKASRRMWKILLSAVGIAFCHAVGVLQYTLITGNGLLASIATTSLPFLLKDIILIFSGYFVSKYLLKAIKFRN